MSCLTSRHWLLATTYLVGQECLIDINATMQKYGNKCNTVCNTGVSGKESMAFFRE